MANRLAATSDAFSEPFTYVNDAIAECIERVRVVFFLLYKSRT